MQRRNLIDGTWVESSSGATIVVDDPATAEPYDEIARATATDVDAAVRAARECVDERRLLDMKPGDRGRMLVDMARWMRERADEIAEVLTRESGKTISESHGELATCTGFLEYYGGLADKIEGSYIPLGHGITDYVVPVPYGVSGHIIPWNYPIEITGRGIGPALAAGNAVVVKSPELDPLAITYIGMAAQEVGMPPGAVNIVAGFGHDAGEALSHHPEVNQITFTGSVETGRKILHAAADKVIPAVVELGGKSPGIVLPDADLDAVTEETRWGIFSNAGQVCSALSRLVVPEQLHDEIVDRVVGVASSLSVGAGIDDPDMGPIISSKQLEQVDRRVRTAVEDGAVIAVGGARVDDLPGHFYQPTVLVDVSNDMAVAREEVFGPVLSVIPYRTPEEALAIANDSDYGLVAGVFGNDLATATEMADRLEAGQIFINKWFTPGIEAPFGGFKQSGFGREKGQAAIHSYIQWKNVGISRP